MPDFIHALEDCINNTEDAVHKLSGAVQSFQPGVADMPRLSKVLNNRHRCLVLPSTQIQAHQAQISGSIAPQIENLISRAETLASSQAARVSNLEERLSILQSRHQPASRQADSTASQAGPDPGESVATGGEVEASYLEDVQMKDLSIPQRRKFMALKTRRARLEKEWEAHLRETGRA